MKTYSFDEAKDKYLGKKGTEKRENYEYELRLELIAEAIKTARKERNLTQEQLGELVGVKKAPAVARKTALAWLCRVSSMYSASCRGFCISVASGN